MLARVIIVIFSEGEAFVVRNTRNINENLEKFSEVTPLDGILDGNISSKLSYYMIEI